MLHTTSPVRSEVRVEELLVEGSGNGLPRGLCEDCGRMSAHHLPDAQPAGGRLHDILRAVTQCFGRGTQVA
eukprot:2285602-Prorocentrum_lima.AAC.1